MGANVGQAVFNVAGLVVSYYFGPLAGALVATAGQALFPAGGNIKGPRAQDQGFTTSQAGLDIPLVIGTQKVAGNVIWAGPLVEHKKSQSAKGGGPKATTYTYTRSFALLLCEGPITGVRRIWRNGKIIYDRTPQGDDESDADFRERDAANTKIETQLRVYQGTEDQLPDPLQEADKGVGNVPAYRGLAYLTLENHDITDMGGRVPNFESEIVEVGTNLTDADPEYRQEFLAPWVKALHPENCENEHEYNGGAGWKSTLDEALFDAGGISNYYGWAVGPLLVYPYFDVDPEENKILELHFNTYNVSRRYGTLDPPCGDAILCCELNTVYPGPVWWTGMNTGGASSGSQHPGVYFTGAGGSTGVVQNCLDENNDPWYSVTIEYDITINVRRVPSKPGTLCNPLCALSKPLLPEDSRFCVLDDGSLSYAGPLTKSDASTSWKILVDPLPYEAPDGSIAHLPAIPDWDDRYSDQEFWEAAAAAAILKGIEIPTGLFPKPVYGIHYPVTKVGPTWKVLQKYTESGSDVAKYPLGPALPDFDSRYSDSDFWTTAYTQAKVTEGTAWPQGIPEGLVYGSNYPVTQSYAYARVPPDLQAMYSDDVTLAHAVTRIAERCALSADQIDVSELTETLTGIRVASNGSGRTVIQQLQQYGFFDAVEVDGLLRFPLRGKTHVATLDEDELGAHNPGEDVPPLATLERAEPAELPKQLNVKFDDVNNEYQVGQQSAMWLTDDASSIQDVELAIAMDSQKAAQIADVAISTIWWSRESVQVAAMPNWLKLAAGDAILVPIEGRYERVHIDSAEMPLPTGVISMRATRDDSAVYASYRVGVPAVTPPQRPTAVGPTDVTVLDIPSLRDADTDGGFYVAVRGSLANSASTWPGCTVQISTDGQATWTDVDTVTRPAIVGAATDALAAPEISSTGFDETNILTVTLPTTNELQSVTDEQLLTGANPCALGAAGRWELLQFGDHTDNGDGTRDLSHLLRAERGTDGAAAAHAAGDTFVFLQDGILRIPLDSSFIGSTIYLRAVSIGTSEGSAEIIEVIPTGASWRGTIIDGGDLDA